MRSSHPNLSKGLEGREDLQGRWCVRSILGRLAGLGKEALATEKKKLPLETSKQHVKEGNKCHGMARSGRTLQLRVKSIGTTLKEKGSHWNIFSQGVIWMER